MSTNHRIERRVLTQIPQLSHTARYGFAAHDEEGRRKEELILKQAGKGLIKVNGKPLALVQPEILRFKVYEPVLILGLDKFGMETPVFRN
jgi:hypothetical protein